MKGAGHPCVLFSVVALLTQTATGLTVARNGTSPVEVSWDHDHNASTIPPMLILQRGCTGSSAVIRMAKSLLADLGVPVYPIKKKEIARIGHPSKNPWYTPGGSLADAMRRGVQEASEAGQVLVFNAFTLKSWTKNKAEQSLNKAMLDMDTRTVIVHRRNPLDILTCEIRDCFQSIHGVPRGYPVNEKGEKDQTCFHRRFEDGNMVRTKAFIDVEHLPENLRTAQNYPRVMQKSVRELGFKGGSIVYFEDLVSHEYSRGNLLRSCRAWQELLSSLGVEADLWDIYHVLKKDVGTYPPPKPHSEAIFNLEQVEGMLSSPAMSSVSPGSLLRG